MTSVVGVTAMPQEEQLNHAMCSIDELYAELSSSNEGLTVADCVQRLQEDGLNELYKPPRPTLAQLFLAQMGTLMIIVLMFAAVADLLVTITGKHRNDGLHYCTFVAIVLIIAVNAGIAAWTENKAGDALEALAKMSTASATVVRGGIELQVPTNTVVRGDMVLLGTGDVVPADLRLVTAEDLKVSEMALTGEPEDVSKTWKIKANSDKLTPDNMVFSSCPVTNGRATGIVVAVGMNTRIGGIASLMTGDHGKDHSKDIDQHGRHHHVTARRHQCCECFHIPHSKETPLQAALNKFSNRISIISIMVCVIMYIAGIILKRHDPENPSEPTALYMLMVAVTLAVASIPEGIPLCVTIALSVGCKDMVKQMVLVRKISAVETLGCASVICSDKTGTLTEGKMNMVKAYSGGVCYNVSGGGFVPVGKFTRSTDPSGEECSKDKTLFSTLLAALMCCNTTLIETKDPDTGTRTWTPKGNSSEAPIVVAARKAGVTEQEVSSCARVLEVPFSSARKMMLTVSDVSTCGTLGAWGIGLPKDTKYLAVVKGAPNYIVDYCGQCYDEHGTVGEFTKELKDATMNAVDEFSDEALRVLAVAIYPCAEMPFDESDDDLTVDDKFKAITANKFQFLGLVASIDRPRVGVAESVKMAHEAGIRVVMITGDYLKTACAIGREVNILGGGANAVENAVDCMRMRPDGKYLPDSAMDQLTSATRVFARAKPEDKLEIVKSLQRQGLVTAMTGDGVNDAPALNQADIGVAMGIQGTEVAKGASAMILLDDNFCSIVDAVHKGRVIYAGIQKFVTFIMSVHIAEILQIFICVLGGLPVMRTPLLILFLVLVTDLPPSIALGMEKGEPTLMKQMPRPKDEPVALGFMWFSMIFNGLNICIIIFILYVVALRHFCDGFILQADIEGIDDAQYKIEKARTVAFISLVWADNLRCYTARSFTLPVYKGFFSNPAMFKAVAVAQVGLYIACFVPVLSEQILALHGIGIGIWGWAICLFGPLGSLVLCETLKIFTAMQVRALERKKALRVNANAELTRSQHKQAWK
eukprot:CAMPEP_0183485008 /NCGR_PEP_ID=MMETSP0370-20130417/179207_1 /TAXON_ID=268820 /ORGANISM="Peridinium aciculiferum, Strain PAER-2" /LENGTH=1042 /DNA_ID=CAMNT_0025678303 /DNA_START=31 /DNA_END=3159 /DNA_ORIENTATION=-